MGRRRIHADAAARQRAYRERKAAELHDLEIELQRLRARERRPRRTKAVPKPGSQPKPRVRGGARRVAGQRKPVPKRLSLLG